MSSMNVPYLAIALATVACNSPSGSGAAPKSAPEAKASPEAKAPSEVETAPETKATPETKPEARPEAKPSPEAPSRSGAFEFEHVLELELREGPGPTQWMASAAVRLSEAQESLLEHNSVDPHAEGLKSPFPKDAPLTLVTAEGVFSRKVTRYELYREMDDDVLVGLLGEAEGGKGLAIIGAAQPASTARMRQVEHEPASAALIAELRAEYEGRSAKLLAKFEPIDDPDQAPDLAKLTLEPSCVRVTRATLPEGFDRIVEVGCGGDASYEPKLEAMFLAGEGKRRPLHDGSDWSLGYGVGTITGAVDLDGDGVDELFVEISGYELYETSTLAWDGRHYARLPRE